MFKSLLKKIFGDPNQKEIQKYTPLVAEVNQLAAEMAAYSDEELQQMMTDLRQTLAEATAAQRAQVKDLQEQTIQATGKERQQLQIEFERAEKELLKLEAELLHKIQAKVFAAVREASRRTIGLVHYDVQVVGGAILHQGKVVEMRTGEGKTLVATMPIALNALLGRGAHVITVNDYLAKRDAQWMGPVYHLLGFSVGVIQSGGGESVDKASYHYNPGYHNADDRYQNLEPVTRQRAYACDITYGTNNEFGFDYLRDNMVRDLKHITQRERHYAIIDEVDNILIDEARTPLIISGQAEESSELYQRFAHLVRPLRRSSDASVEEEAPDGDYVLDEKSRIVYLTERGLEKIERALGVENLYEEGKSAAMIPYLDNALRAQTLFKLDVDYVVHDGEVIIVDEFTGRLMHGRRYSEGLHQAIEAKEGVKVRHESITWATITFQNFFRMYDKLAGMTGTAETEAEEFGEIYNLDVVVLPTNIEYRAIQGDLRKESRKEDGAEIITYRSPDGSELYHKRIDYPDQVYKSPQAKFRALIGEIKKMQEQGRPVLVGTIAIETSEYLSDLLHKQGIEHKVLNAKKHEQEAIIILQAGRPGTVTIATNMAGRGVDILLGGNAEGLARDDLRHKGVDLTALDPTLWERTLHKWQERVAKDRQEVLKQGGLHVIGTERHEARRIDNQLRGRAGRQGDPGSSRFYVSLQDDLMRRFGGQNVANLMDRFGVEEDIPIEADVISKSIENAQTKVEGYNFDIRKHLLKYDDVINQQREVIYAERQRVLASPNLKESIQSMVFGALRELTQTFVAGHDPEDWDLPALYSQVRGILPSRQPEKSQDKKSSEDKPENSEPLPEGEAKKEEDGHKRWADMLPHEIEAELLKTARTLYEQLEQTLGETNARQWEKHAMLQAIDTLWVRHLTALDALRQGIGLRAYGQQDPLVAFQKEAFEMYGQLRDAIQEDVVRKIYHYPSPTALAEKRSTAINPRNMKAIHPDAIAAARQAQAGASIPERPPEPVRVSKGPGRNDLCPCGSGKKYKHCHEKLDRAGGRQQPEPASRPDNQQKKKEKAHKR
jgi:preprotein translocase subunit SecA